MATPNTTHRTSDTDNGRQKSSAEMSRKSHSTPKEEKPERTDLDESECGPLLTNLADIRVGMKIEAKDFYGKWYVAKVIEIEEDDQEVLVHFEKWNSRYDEYIKISNGRLRILPPGRLEAIEKEQENTRKVLCVGDLVQAKWEDGRMYFGKVLKVLKDEVDILYDDGVRFKAPISAVRRRRLQSRSNLSRSSYHESDSSQTPNSRALRAQKRHRSDDSTSQTSFSSPPSSPVFVPSKRRRTGRVESDSTEFDSDLDGSSSHTHEHPLPEKRMKRNNKSKHTISVSSDSEGTGVQGPTRKRKRSHEDVREPYKLRHSSQLSVNESVVKLSPVKEYSDAMCSTSVVGRTNKHEGLSALLTPPVDSPASSNMDDKTENNLLPDESKHEENQISVSDPTPPETPVSQSRSSAGSKRVTRDHSENSRPNTGHVTDSPSKKAAVALRTRAQTKFDSATSKKGDTKKSVKVAPKEMVIVWDHNEFKCKFTGCNKSFRKDTLLQSHIKHYHSDSVKSNKQVQKQKGASVQSGKSQLDKEIHNKKESSTSPSHKFPQRSTSPPLLSESPLSPGQSQKGNKSTKTQKRSSLNPTPATKGSKISPKNKNKDNREVVKKEKLSSLSEYLQSGNSKESAIRVLPQEAVKIESTTPSQTVSETRLTNHETKESTTPLTKSNKKSKPSLGNSQPTMFSVVGPPMKVPLVEIKALPRESLSLHTPVKKQTKAPSYKEGDVLYSEEVGSYGTLSRTGVCRRVLQEENDNDVVHCVCGDLTDEGFMIQCEQCLCWQHGDCIQVSKNALPEKYVCSFCTNPPGQRSRFKYQFDREWFGEGKLPNIPGAPKFPHSSLIKESHQLTDTVYKLKKMLHSSKVKLQAASRVNHPYLRQWAKECSHLQKVDIISYLIAALIPISYCSQLRVDSKGNFNGMETDGHDHSTVQESNKQRLLTGSEDKQHNDAHDGDDTTQAQVSNGTRASTNEEHCISMQNDTPINVSSLSLDPLPLATPHGPFPDEKTSSEGPNESSPDPKTLKLAPLPPLNTEDMQQLTTEILKKSIQLSVSNLSVSNRNTSKTVKTEDNCSTTNEEAADKPSSDGTHSPKLKSDTHEVINDEFGVQELFVFALDTDKSKSSQADNLPTSVSQSQPSSSSLCVQTSPGPNKVTTSTRSAFMPVITQSCHTSSSAQLKTSLPSSSSSGSTVRSSNATPLTVGPAQTIQSFTDTNTRSPRVSVIASSFSSSSTMDSVSLGEFADAFMQGDTTNWFQRMQLLDHIDNVQEKVATWMDKLDQQLEELPDEDHCESIGDLLKDVQTTMTQLRQLQQTIT